MSQLIDNILARSTGQKIGIWMISLLLVSGLAYQYVYMPTALELEELQKKKMNLRGRVAQESKLARNLEKYKAKVAELDGLLMLALKELPEKKEIDQLLDSVSGIARSAGLDITNVTMQPERIKQFYSEVPMSVSVQGTFHQIAAFFDDVGQMQRIVNVTDIAISDSLFKETKTVRGMSNEISTIPVKATLNATTFKYLDEAEMAAVAASNATEDKKRRK